MRAKNKHDHGSSGAPKARGHHCEIQSHEVDKGKKECRKAGGVWMDGPPRLFPEPAPPVTGR